MGTEQPTKKRSAALEHARRTRAPKNSADWIGRNIAGRFRVDKLLGAGGNGAVYAATQLSLGQKVAVKVMLPAAAMDDWWRGRFVNEAKIYAKINSPYVVKVHDFGEEPDGALFLVMEFLPGIDLAHVLKREGGRLETSRLCLLTSQMLRGLSAAHDHGIVHRDLKPANIMILDADTEKPFAKVLDFGIGKVDGQAADPALAMDKTMEGLHKDLTMMGPVVGTPAFMAPEQISGGEVDGRADIYSMGVMLFAMATGQVPFDGKDSMSIVRKHLYEDPPRPSSMNPEAFVPPDLEAIILRCLEKFPDDRYQTARDMLAEIDQLSEELFGPQLVRLASMREQDGLEGRPVPVSTRAFGQADDQLDTRTVDAPAEKEDEGATAMLRPVVMEFLTQLGKAYKSFQMYPRDNPIYREAMETAWTSLAKIFEKVGQLDLSVDRFAILYKKKQVYEDLSLRDSYPFKLFTDGVRRLFFAKGITRAEMTEYFDCLHDVSQRASASSDLVTLLWERELEHVKFHLVEDLVVDSTPDAASLRTQRKAARRTGFRGAPHREDPDEQVAPGAAPTAASAEQLMAPLNAQEKQHLTELQRYEAEADHVQSFVRSLLNVMKASKRLDDVSTMIRVLGETAQALLSMTDLEHGLQILGALRKIRASKGGEKLAEQFDEIFERCGSEAIVGRVIGAMIADGDEKADVESLEAWLSVLPPHAAMGILRSAPSQGDRILGAIERAISVVVKDDPMQLADALESERRAMIRIAARVLAKLRARETAPLLEKVIDDPVPEIRAEVIRALGAIQPENIATIVAPRLEDKMSAVRGAAIEALAAAPESVSMIPLLSSLATKHFAERGRGEQIRLLRALASMKNPEVLTTLERQMSVGRRLSEHPLTFLAVYAVSITLAVKGLGVVTGGLLLVAALACLHQMGWDLVPPAEPRSAHLFGPLSQCLKRIGTPNARAALARVQRKRRSEERWGKIIRLLRGGR